MQLVELNEVQVPSAAHALEREEREDDARGPRDEPRQVAHALADPALAPRVEPGHAVLREELVDNTK